MLLRGSSRLHESKEKCTHNSGTRLLLKQSMAQSTKVRRPCTNQKQCHIYMQAVNKYTDASFPHLRRASEKETLPHGKCRSNYKVERHICHCAGGGSTTLKDEECGKSALRETENVQEAYAQTPSAMEKGSRCCGLAQWGTPFQSSSWP